jgi:DNA-binding transcriptional regulator YhcF (GntR family)
MQAFSLNHDSPIPVKLQLKAHVRYQILAGLLRPADQLPPLRDLAAGLGVHLNTVVRAMDELEAEGYLHTHQGKGVFVAEEFPGQGNGAALRSLLAGVIQSAREWEMSPEEMALAVLAHGGLARPPQAASHRVLVVGGYRPLLRLIQSQLESALPVAAVPALSDELAPRLRTSAGGPVVTTLFHSAAVRLALPGAPVTVLAETPEQEAFAALTHLPAGTTVAAVARDWVHAARIRQSAALVLPDTVNLVVAAGQDAASLAPAVRGAGRILAAAACNDLVREVLGPDPGDRLLVEPATVPPAVLATLRRTLGAPAAGPGVHVRSAWV